VTAPSVLVTQHGPQVPPGYVEAALIASGFDYEILPLHTGTPVPGTDGWDGIVSLGGAMGAYDEVEYPYLSAEKELLRAAVAADVPVLGLCLGCQLLADALGGRVYRTDLPEIAFTTIPLTKDGAADPVLGVLTGPTLTFHQDTWDLPPGAVLLATTEMYPQAFRFGSAVGIQPHPEAPPEVVAEWITSEVGERHLAAAAVDGRAVVAAMEHVRDESEAMAGRLFAAWLAEVRRCAAEPPE
jgi:GMP synthase (glutamine-hydrolysing)